jgi:xylan 1,4-beta-xylosidase
MGGDRIRLVASAGGVDVVLTVLDGRFWTAETTASFTGRVVGLYATDGTMTFTSFRSEGSDAQPG